MIWSYPAVKFEQLMRVRASADSVRLGNPQSAVNQLGLIRQLRGPEFKQVATPNNDTLYAQAFCDLSREPLIVSVPKVDKKRYHGIPLWDPNGNTFAYIGTRTTGREAGDYALVGPDWKGTLPAGVKRIDSPYNGLVVWGRIGVDGPSDLDNALAIQDQLRLTPLSQFGKSDKQAPPDLAFSETRLADRNPQHVTGELEFFVELANSLKHTPPKAQHDAPSEATERANWLPPPAGGFNLNLRLYVPDDSLQKGTWKPPVVKPWSDHEHHPLIRLVGVGGELGGRRRDRQRIGPDIGLDAAGEGRVLLRLFDVRRRALGSRQWDGTPD